MATQRHSSAESRARMDYLFQISGILDYAVHDQIDGIFAVQTDGEVVLFTLPGRSSTNKRLKFQSKIELREKGKKKSSSGYKAIAMSAGFMFLANEIDIFRYKVCRGNQFTWDYDQHWNLKLGERHSMKLSCQEDGMTALVSDGAKLQWVTARNVISNTSVSSIDTIFHLADATVIHPTTSKRVYYTLESQIYIAEARQQPFTKRELELEKVLERPAGVSSSAVHAKGAAFCYVSFPAEQTGWELVTIDTPSNIRNPRTLKLNLPCHHYSIPILTHILFILYNIWCCYSVLNILIDRTFGSVFYALCYILAGTILFLVLSSLSDKPTQFVGSQGLRDRCCFRCCHFLINIFSVLLTVLSLGTAFLGLIFLYCSAYCVRCLVGYRYMYFKSLADNTIKHWRVLLQTICIDCFLQMDCCGLCTPVKPNEKSVWIKTCRGRTVLKYGNYFFQINESIGDFGVGSV